ncbi:hypothetical protein OG742_42160 [Streptomyces sp. NBC_00828]|uniref:hypothetical protein n=1 Tax=Streptomyces sp. NBC_00828 TaxID=2903678 RepID=UPI00386DDC17
MTAAETIALAGHALTDRTVSGAVTPLPQQDHHDECDKSVYDGDTCTCDLIEQYGPPSNETTADRSRDLIGQCSGLVDQPRVGCGGRTFPNGPVMVTE